MLAQSRTDRVDLLPALPAAWPAGSIHGLSLRTSCTLDLTWADAKLTSAVLHANRDASFTVRYREKSAPVRLKKGEAVQLNAELVNE
jgi:alpha-L-fucosidase 2